MTTDTYAPSAVGERIRELCREFKLPTLASETVGRFSEAGHAAALPTLVEVLEQEAEDRRIRREWAGSEGRPSCQRARRGISSSTSGLR